MPSGIKLTVNDYNIISERNGIAWLGDSLPKNNSTVTTFICKNGHIFYSTYARIYQGKLCRKCYEDSMRLTESDYLKLAKKNEFKFIGPVVEKNSIKTKWECKYGHIFQACYGSIQCGNGCKKCRDNNLRLYENSYVNLAKDNDFIWIGPIVGKTSDKTQWKCKKCNNIWWANYNNISRGRGCPKCKMVINGAIVSKPQIELANIVNGILNYQVSNKKIDVFIIRENVKIAIEYDTWFWHGYKQECDKKRALELIQNGYKVISIKSNTKLPSFNIIDNAIKNLVNSSENYTEIILDDWGIGNLATSIF